MLQRFSISTGTLFICLLLVGITLFCYWPVFSHQFVCFDDQHYLFDSGYVAKGLTWQGTNWALRTGYFSNWHPVTWLSFMLDAQIFGMNPAGFHFTSLLFHIANSLLLFLLVKKLTQRLWPSAIVAALFAWHPLHVESVAWVSERKDVLSTFFFLLTIISYVRYVEERENSSPLPHHASRYYLLSLLAFMLALMSKQMVVTLPCVLFLLDYWPLRRISLGTASPEQVETAAKTRNLLSSNTVRSALALLREKLPYFALALAASAVIFAVQRAGGSVSTAEVMPIRYRIANALLAYAAYLGDTFWPVHLSAVYPMRFEYSIVAVSIAAILMGGISLLAVVRARQNPFLPVGWFWFVGTLVPVIGFIQVGAQSRADRYTYIPSIGLSIVLVWGIDALCCSLASRASRRRVEIAEVAASQQASVLPDSSKTWASGFQIVASVAALAASLFLSRIQVGYWHDSEKLFRHSVALDPNNYLAYNCLGGAYDLANRKKEAIQCLREAVRLAPGFVGSQYNLGTLLLGQGEFDEAISHLKIAIKALPTEANAHQNLGYAYVAQGRLREATVEYAESAALSPENANFRADLGSVLLKQSRWNEAASVLSDAVKLDTNNADANWNCAIALVAQGKRVEAIRYFSQAVRLKPHNSDIRFNLGLALLEENQPQQAAEQFTECLRLDPNEARSHYRLAVALARLHNLKDAIFHCREALRLTPDSTEAMNELAHLLACAPQDDLRDGTEAVKLAEKACAMTDNKNPAMLTTLAAAYAESGRFQDAVAAAQKAHDLAATNGQPALAAKAGELLDLCMSGRSLRE